MTGVIENMPVEARMQRLETLATFLLELIRQSGSMSITDALEAAAAALRTAISQIKQGLNYALNNSMLRLEADDMLIPVG